MAKECSWCSGTISISRFIVSLGCCLTCGLKKRDYRATAPPRGGNKGKKVR